jgi:hypothetical protein
MQFIQLNDEVRNGREHVPGYHASSFFITHEGTLYLNRGPIGCPETSAIKYQPSLRNIPGERRPHLHPGGSLKSRIFYVSRLLRFLYFVRTLMSNGE